MLSAYLDSELDAGTTLQVAQHIERCTACASRLEQLAQLDACLKQSLASTDVEDQACRQRAAGINQAVLARIRAEAGIQGSSTTAQRLFRWSHRSGGWLSGWLSQWLSRPFSWRRLTVALSLGMACGLALMLVTRERFQPEAPRTASRQVTTPAPCQRCWPSA
jgi:anti-sigma factor RsiW